MAEDSMNIGETYYFVVYRDENSPGGFVVDGGPYAGPEGKGFPNEEEAIIWRNALSRNGISQPMNITAVTKVSD
jgi:hypothetical protein